MASTFGPQLIGETEKTLNALLGRCLDRTGLSEPQWVTLRLADMLDDSIDAAGLAAAVGARAHFRDASELVADLTERGLLEHGRLSSAGHEVVDRVQATIAREAAPIWSHLDHDDVAAATRVLNEVLSRARTALG